METNINELMAISAILSNLPLIKPVGYEEESNSEAITHIRAINYEEAFPENTVGCDTVNKVSQGWWSKYLC